MSTVCLPREIRPPAAPNARPRDAHVEELVRRCGRFAFPTPWTPRGAKGK